jgi:hypothetical protein
MGAPQQPLTSHIRVLVLAQHISHSHQGEPAEKHNIGGEARRQLDHRVCILVGAVHICPPIIELKVTGTVFGHAPAA